MDNYNDFCKGVDCPEYIEWDFGYGPCVSCKKAGESHNIEKYPDDCPNIIAIQAIQLDS